MLLDDERETFSGYCIGGPEHGELVCQKSPRYQVMENQPLPSVAELRRGIGPQEVCDYVHHTYLYRPIFTEWGRETFLFIWELMTRLSEEDTQKFLAAAIDGGGYPRKVRRANRELIWPGAPDWWGR